MVRSRLASWFIRCGLIFVFIAALAAATGGSVYSYPSASPGDAPNLVAAVTVSPVTAVPNQQISLFGTGFTPATTSGGNGPGGAHQITGVGMSGVTVSGSLLAAPNVNYPINIDSNGNWSVSVVVPVNLTSLVGGTQEIRVIDDNGVLAVSSYTLPIRTLTVSPSTGRRNSAVTVTGTGYPAANALGATSPAISIDYGVTFVGTFTADATGNLSAVIIVPFSASNPSTNSITTTILGHARTNSATHIIPGSAITVTPSTGPAGTVATVSGTDFYSFVSVSAINAGAVSIMSLPSPNTNSLGEFTASVIIPAFPAGSQTILATAGGVSAIANFVITDGPAPLSSSSTTGSSAGTGVALDALISTDNLLRVWNFSNATKEWFFYDPRPAFAAANSLTEMVSGQPYWVMVVRDQSALLNTSSRSLYAGWNLIPW
jgi:hypothetical protein